MASIDVEIDEATDAYLGLIIESMTEFGDIAVPVVVPTLAAYIVVSRKRRHTGRSKDSTQSTSCR